MKVLILLLLVVAATQAFECPGGGSYPAADCSGFYICGYNPVTDEVEVVLFVPCPEGTLYNAPIMKCQSTSVFECPSARTYYKF